MTTGMDLRLARVSRRLKVKDVATAMSVNRTRISYIEAQAVVTEEAARRYLAAVATLEALQERSVA